MSFRREVLERVGGFDTHIAGPASFGDEVEIAYRIRKAGYRIAVAQKAVLTHLAVPSGGCRPEDGRPREYWRSYIRNQVLVYLKTHSLLYRMALPFWLVRFGRTVQQLSGGLLKQDEFAQAASEGVTAYNQSRRVRSYLAKSPSAPASTNNCCTTTSAARMTCTAPRSSRCMPRSARSNAA
jgi:hypothetical protein